MSLPQEVQANARMCFQKKAYPSEKFAKEVARGVLKKRGAMLRVYQCPNCALFHLTAQVVA